MSRITRDLAAAVLRPPMENIVPRLIDFLTLFVIRLVVGLFAGFIGVSILLTLVGWCLSALSR